MENHHEDPKPTNKWLATPILAAVLFVSCVVGFLTIATGQCCGGECKEKTKTEHSTEHTTGTHEEEGDDKDVTASDSTGTAKDSTDVEEGEEEHAEGHEEHEGH